jgi:transposase-like protein/IS1 family transposase
VRHSLLRTRHGTKHRWRCKLCGLAFTANHGTPYHRLRSSLAHFDRAVHWVMEGTTQASIARSEGLSASTVRRWFERATRAPHDFNQRAVRNLEPVEIQVDELRSYAGHRDNRQFVFAAIDVSPRFWLASAVGKRTRRSCRLVMRQARNRCSSTGKRVLIVTDPFQFYRPEVQLTWGRTCVHVESGKIIRRNRIVRVNNDLVWATQEQLDEVRSRCEDSKTINTAFIERLNLTMRKSLSCLQRKTNSAAKTRETLEARIDLLQVYYNFVRPHRSLKFGSKLRSPAQQAGLVTRVLSWRDVFLSFRPMARLAWLSDELTRREWSKSLPCLGSDT